MAARRLQFINPVLLAENRERLTGSVPLQALPRLKELLLNDQGCVNYQLQFGRDDQGILHIQGEFSVNLSIACQRCMQPMDLQLAGPIKLGLSDRDTSKKLPEYYEPLVLNGDQIALETLVEDELLLALPMVPLHEWGQCKETRAMEHYRAKSASPFAVLKKHKDGKFKKQE
jgi:uncharacterized protein